MLCDQHGNPLQPGNDQEYTSGTDRAADIRAMAELLGCIPLELVHEAINDGLDVDSARALFQSYAAIQNRPVKTNPDRKFPESSGLESLPHQLTDARRAELRDLTEFTKTAIRAVFAARELFEAVAILRERGDWPEGTPVSGLYRLWKNFLPPLVEVAQLEPPQLPFWETLVNAREKLAGFNDRLIVWHDSQGREQTADHWHDAVWTLSFGVLVALSNAADAHDVLCALQHSGVLCESSINRVISGLKRESEEALKEIARFVAEAHLPKVDSVPVTNAGKKSPGSTAQNADSTPDEIGYVQRPSDPTAYIPQSDILGSHTPPDWNMKPTDIVKIVEDYQAGRVRWTRPIGLDDLPRTNRRNIHLADWINYVRRVNRAEPDGTPMVAPDEKESRQALIRAKKKKPNQK